MRKHLRTIVLVGLSIALMAFFFRNADLASVWAGIRRARLDLLAASVVATALSYVIRIRRWQELLVPLGQVGFGSAGRATAIGYATTAVLPGKLGEVLRPYLLARSERLSASAALATIVLERLLDVIAVVLLFGVFLLFFSETIRQGDQQTLTALEGAGLTAAVASGAALWVLVAAARAPDRANALVARAAGLLPERVGTAVTRFFHKFAAGLGIARRPGRLLGVLAWSLLLWLSVAATAWFVCHAFAIPLPASGSLLMMVMMVMGAAVPTPAGVGGFHAAFQIGVTRFYDAPVDAAVGAALIAHAVSFVPITIIGGLLMFRTGLTLHSAVDLAWAGPGGSGKKSPPAMPDPAAAASEHGESGGVK